MSLSTVTKTGYVPVGEKRGDNPAVKIYYELHGEGEEHVVLIMGLNTSCLAWENQTKYLAETGKYTVLIFDNRGMGMSDSPSGFYTTSQMAEDAIEVFDHLGWDKNIHLNGCSMGGMIALELASTWPERFSSLTLTSTSSGRQAPPWKAVTTLSRLAFIREPKDKIGHAITLVFPDEWLKSKPEEERHMEFATNKDMAVANFLARIERTRPQPLKGNIGQTAAALRHYVSDERLKKIKDSGLPVIVLTGTWDNLVNPKNSHHLSKVLGCHLEVFEGSGHALPTEQSVKYNKLIDEHFTIAAALRDKK